MTTQQTPANYASQIYQGIEAMDSRNIEALKAKVEKMYQEGLITVQEYLTCNDTCGCFWRRRMGE